MCVLPGHQVFNAEAEGDAGCLRVSVTQSLDTWMRRLARSLTALWEHGSSA